MYDPRPDSWFDPDEEDAESEVVSNDTNVSGKLPPMLGRELDALIAAKVMGLKISKEPDPWENDETDNWFVLEPDGKGFRPTNAIKNYSTDIDAAWEVVDKMRSLNRWPRIELNNFGRESWHVNFESGAYAHGETAPHAICLAALKAVESKDPK